MENARRPDSTIREQAEESNGKVYQMKVTMGNSVLRSKSYHQIKERSDSNKWYQVLDKELKALQSVGHMTFVPRPIDRRIITSFKSPGRPTLYKIRES